MRERETMIIKKTRITKQNKKTEPDERFDFDMTRYSVDSIFLIHLGSISYVSGKLLRDLNPINFNHM